MIFEAHEEHESNGISPALFLNLPTLLESTFPAVPHVQDIQNLPPLNQPNSIGKPPTIGIPRAGRGGGDVACSIWRRPSRLSTSCLRRAASKVEVPLTRGRRGGGRMSSSYTTSLWPCMLGPSWFSPLEVAPKLSEWAPRERPIPMGGSVCAGDRDRPREFKGAWRGASRYSDELARFR